METQIDKKAASGALFTQESVTFDGAYENVRSVNWPNQGLPRREDPSGRRVEVYRVHVIIRSMNEKCL